MDLKVFFSKTREDIINQRFVSSGDKKDCSDVLSYIDDILSIPFRDYLGYIKGSIELPYVLSSDVPQFSSISSATDLFCSRLHNGKTSGYSFEEIGILLQPDSTKDFLANKKYGENHVKTAVELGLALLIGRYYYLSAIGYVYPSLLNFQKEQLLSRLVLRNNLVYNILYKTLNNHDVDLLDEISFLSESTAKRRKNNSLVFCRLIALNKEIPVQSLLDRIK